MRAGMRAHFDPDPAAAHLVGDSCCGTGAEEAVEDQIAWLRSDVKNALDQALWLGGSKNFCWVQFFYFLLGFLIVANLITSPDRLRNDAFLDLGKKAFQ